MHKVGNFLGSAVNTTAGVAVASAKAGANVGLQAGTMGLGVAETGMNYAGFATYTAASFALGT